MVDRRETDRRAIDAVLTVLANHRTKGNVVDGVDQLSAAIQQAISDVAAAPVRTKYSHYHKNVAGLNFVDVYRVLAMFSVTDPCLQHAVKKLLVAGGRGAGKDISRDIAEAIDSLTRWQEMRTEDEQAQLVCPNCRTKNGTVVPPYRDAPECVECGIKTVPVPLHTLSLEGTLEAEHRLGK